MAGTLFFAGKLRKSRKNSEFWQFSAFFAEKLGFSQIFLEKFAFFRKKKGGASAKKIIISAKTKTQRASLTLFARETCKERPERSLRETLFGTLFTEDKVPHTNLYVYEANMTPT